MVSDDAFLVNEATNGSPGAFDLLVTRYYRRIGVLVFQKVGRCADAEDLIQETFTKAYLALGQLKEPAKFGSWLYQIAAMTAIDYLRKKRLRKTASIEEMQERDWVLAADEQPEPIEPEVLQKVMKALDELPEDYRVVVTLRFLEGMRASDIAKHLGEPAGTVRNRIFRANAMLREKLKDLW
jgi:RNA polymerase sigma-70 factor (ECF subfamily)